MPKNQHIRLLDVQSVRLFSHSNPEGVAVIMPCTDTEAGMKTAEVLNRRADMPCTILVVQDTKRQGFIKTLNQTAARVTARYIVYLAQDAWPGRGWLRCAYDALEKSGKALLAFNDGKWKGRIASFGMVRTSWVKTLYGGPFFYPEYISHGADNELTVLARVQDTFVYNPECTLVEHDPDKDLGGSNPKDRTLFKKRFIQGFGGLVQPGKLEKLALEYKVKWIPPGVSVAIRLAGSDSRLKNFLRAFVQTSTDLPTELIILDPAGASDTAETITRYSTQTVIRHMVINHNQDTPGGTELVWKFILQKARYLYIMLVDEYFEYDKNVIHQGLKKLNTVLDKIIKINPDEKTADTPRFSPLPLKELFSGETSACKNHLATGVNSRIKGTCLLVRKNELEAVKAVHHGSSGKNFPSQGLDPGSDVNESFHRRFIQSVAANRKYRKFSNNDKTVNTIKHLRFKLYNLGFTERAYNDLKILADDLINPRMRRLAARELAVWHANKYNRDDSQKCLEWLSIARQGEADPVKSRQHAVLEAESLQALGQTEKARRIIEQELKKEKHADLYLALANLEQETSNKLAWINKALSLHGLAEIICIPESKATPYDGLQAKPGAINKPELPKATPKVTVIIPAYNAQNIIRTALDSIINQTWSNLEVLVVDDCSTDQTVEVVKDYELRDTRVRLIRTESNQGPYVARNLALREATGELVTVNDADDWSHPERIEIQVRHLQKNPDVVANTSELSRAFNDLRFFRRGQPGSFIQFNMSSLMFHRQKVVDKLGYWDSVRFAADSEFKKRIIKCFGNKSVIDLVSGPLSFPRQSEDSLTSNLAYGFQGFFMGARRVYQEIFTWWHNKSVQPYMDFPLRIRQFSIPEPMHPPLSPKNKYASSHLDVVIATEFGLSGGTTASTIEEIKAHLEFGLQTGLVHLARYDLKPSPWNERLLELIDGKKVRLITYGEEVTCDLLIIRHPPVLQEYQSYTPKIKAGNVLIIANQAPLRDYGNPESRVYDLQACSKNMQRYFQNPGTWHPIGPAVREALTQESGVGTLFELSKENWYNIINVDQWRIKKKRSKKNKPVIGRHSRDQYVKWPENKEELLAAYPENNRFPVQILGGAEAPRNILGYIPENWTVYPFDFISPKEFLAGIDVFVYFTHTNWVEAFGRTPLEAMAAGIPVILPEKFRTLYKDAAIYATPFEVQSIVLTLYQDQRYYQQQAEKGIQFVKNNFGYQLHRKRLAQYICTLQK